DAGDTVTYDVYFGTSSIPPLVSNDQSGTTYDPETLSNNTKYYWKIVAEDNHGATTSGSVWEFTTSEEVPADCPWLSVSPTSGSVQPGNSATITVTIDTTGLAEEDYSAEIVIASNDPDEDPKIVPVTLHVGEELDSWSYDEGGNGYIEIDELLPAISDYIGGEITISQLLEIISLYISHTPKS
ncbi:unnamed protein product, partial [marine sediment metagenome]